MLTVFVVDDHPVSRWGIRRILEDSPDVQVVGAADSPEEVAAEAEMVILDLFLGDDLPCLSAIRDLSSRCRVLVVSASRDPADREACARAGAHGYVYKGAEPEVLVAAVLAVAAGETVAFDGVAVTVPVAPNLPPLSQRERQVLHHIASGYTHEQSARRLGISRHTVDTYVKRLRRKLGNGNKAFLTRAALLSSGIPDV